MIKMKQYRNQIRESRRRNAVTKLSADDQVKLQRIIDDKNDQEGYFDDDSSYTSSSYYDSNSNSNSNSDSDFDSDSNDDDKDGKIIAGRS